MKIADTSFNIPKLILFQLIHDFNLPISSLELSLKLLSLQLLSLSLQLSILMQYSIKWGVTFQKIKAPIG